MSTESHSAGSHAMAGIVEELYKENQQDYYLEPLVMVDPAGVPVGRIDDADSVIFCCRRGEREVQLTEAFTDPDYPHFMRPNLGNLTFAILTMYHEKFKDLPIGFAPNKIEATLGEAIANAGLKQLRVAESEKFAHITYFLNGGASEPFKNEERVGIPSPKGLPFDQVPGLSLASVSEEVIKGIHQNYDFIATNFANGDVIGHIANNAAKIECASILDSHLGEVVEAAIHEDYVILITADHGILEVMTHPDGSSNMAHTSNLVPVVLIDPRVDTKIVVRDGKLADLAPTILAAMRIKQPEIMDGRVLAPVHDWGGRRKVLLIILDGWGLGNEDDTNPIFLADTPNWDGLLKKYSHSTLHASGEYVGLKSSKAGNSEAGHTNIGAGRVVLQDDKRLDLAMQDGSFYTNSTFCQIINDTKNNGGKLHLIGLLSEKSSHGSIDYPLALLKMAKNSGLEEVYLHMIFDGRSTEPGSAPALLEKFGKQIEEIGVGKIVSGVGRGIALDRDKNYGKIQQAFDCFASGVGRTFQET